MALATLGRMFQWGFHEFVANPPQVIVGNHLINGPDLEIDIKFVDKLIDIGVLQRVLPTENITINFPLSLVNKPEQRGEYRSIADEN